ncbi:MAG: 50S ribosomal protein L24 [bacterium]|nr:50S ribosomal protein L24 [bacterium]
MVARVKKNDKIIVISGKDKGKEGVVIAILPKKGKVMAKGISIATRHTKARKQGETSGIKKEETFIDLVKVMPICDACKKPCRTGSKKLEQNKCVRVCKRCKETF